MSGSAPRTANWIFSLEGSERITASKQASSPWVKVVSIPEPEKLITFTFGKYFSDNFSATVDKSNFITSDGHEPTKKSLFMSGRLDSN